MWFVLKTCLSGVIIAGCSWLATKKPALAGFLTALPLVSILALMWTHIERPNMANTTAYATSIVVAVPLSLTFFVPFLLQRWLKWSFAPTLFTGLVLLWVSYMIHQRLMQGM
jgi:hypothetical protein